MSHEKRDYMNVICKKYLKSHEKSVHINVTGRERIQEYHTNRALIYMKVVKKNEKHV